MASTLRYKDALDAMEQFMRRGWTDGLPVVPPTPALVEEMLAAAGLAPGDVLGEVPAKEVKVTAEGVAANAVMAGCLPEYMPVVVAAMRAALEPEANLETNSVNLAGSSQALIINGPIRNKLGIACKNGLFGPGFRPNSTIGRALRLTVINVCDLNEASYGYAPFSQPRYTFCFGENEEENPWTPLHVDQGFDRATSTVTFYATNARVAVLDDSSRLPEELLDHAAFVFRASGWTLFDGARRPGICAVLVLGPEHVRVLSGAGWSKRRIQGYLWERLTAAEIGYEKPALLASPERVWTIVAGGDGLPQSWWLTPHTSTPVTKRIESVSQ